MTNWEKYFGTPEKVESSIGKSFDQCVFCKLEGENGCQLYPECEMSFAEWLKQEAE